MRKLRFIDLFAGLGGFHLALQDLGHFCVFASEINEDLRTLYQTNYGIKCEGDINKINIKDIPTHDIICAGFPCQPFSKAGKQNGLGDLNNGNFFNRIMKIVNYHIMTLNILMVLSKSVVPYKLFIILIMMKKKMKKKIRGM